MQFRSPAPGNLTLEGSTYYADWSVASDNFGHTASEVVAWVEGALSDPRGLPATGITPRQVNSGNVIFQVVEAIPGNPGRIGEARWNEFPVLVLLEEAYFGNMDLVTHEALHAFLYANHSPLGSDSVLEPLEDPGEEWLSDTDIAQIEAWLAGDFDGTRYWFPGDLPHYITRWVIPPRTKTRLVCTILEAAPVVIRAVCGTSHATLVGGTHQPFGIGMDLASEGFFSTEWTDAPSGELYVGLVVEGATPEEFSDLAVGLAEVQIAGSDAEGGGSPIPG